MSVRAISKKYPRNLPCPCGSGTKYKKCCLVKEFDFALDDSGDVREQRYLGEKETQIIERQTQRFVEKFGREPGPNDPIFFDPSKPTPTAFDEREFDDLIIETMKNAGVPGQFIYAYQKTGRVVVAGDENKLSDLDLAEWTAAVEEYFDLLESGAMEPDGYEGQATKR